MFGKQQWTRRDFAEVGILFLVIVFFLFRVVVFPLRQEPVEAKEVAVQMIRHLWAYTIYSIATVLIIIGLTKKMFKYNPTRKQVIKWAFVLAAVCAVSEFLNMTFEAFKAVSG
jgi:hypothetical protein